LLAPLEEPTIASGRIREDLPAVVVHIPEVKAVGAMLQIRLADLLEIPLGGILYNNAMTLVNLGLSFDV
jgi:hypothetical protein